LKKDSEKSPNKLKRKHKYFVCSLLASGYSPALCVQELKEIYEIEVTEDNIRDNYLNGRKWKPLIAKLSDKFRSKILQHPLAQKYNRLNFLLKAINEAFLKGKISLIANLVREARIECEGSNSIIIQNNDNRISIMQQLHHQYNQNEDFKDNPPNRLKVA